MKAAKPAPATPTRPSEVSGAAAPSVKSPSDVDRSIGERIRALRRSVGISQQGLAQAIGVTFQQVQKYENGTNRLSAGRLHQVAAALGTDLGQIIGSAGAGGPPGDGGTSMRAFMATQGAGELVRFWMTLAPSSRPKALAVLKALATHGADPPSSDAEEGRALPVLERPSDPASPAGPARRARGPRSGP